MDRISVYVSNAAQTAPGLPVSLVVTAAVRLVQALEDKQEEGRAVSALPITGEQFLELGAERWSRLETAPGFLLGRKPSGSGSDWPFAFVAARATEWEYFLLLFDTAQRVWVIRTVVATAHGERTCTIVEAHASRCPFNGPELDGWRSRCAASREVEGLVSVTTDCSPAAARGDIDLTAGAVEPWLQKGHYWASIPASLVQVILARVSWRRGRQRELTTEWLITGRAGLEWLEATESSLNPGSGKPDVPAGAVCILHELWDALSTDYVILVEDPRGKCLAILGATPVTADDWTLHGVRVQRVVE